MRRFVTFLIVLVAVFSAYLIVANVKEWWPFDVVNPSPSPSPTVSITPSLSPSPTTSPSSAPTPTATPHITVTPTTYYTPTPTPTPTNYSTPYPTVSPSAGYYPYVDPAGRYQVSLPQNWTRSRREGTSGLQISYLQFDSSDFTMHNGTGGYSSYVYYDTGARLMIHEVKGSWPQTHPTYSLNPRAGIISTSTINIDGTNATYHVFIAPNVFQGNMIDVHIIRNNITYLLTFVYNADTFPSGPAVFNDILNTFKFR